MVINKEELSQFISTDEGKGVLAEIGLLTTDQHLQKLQETEEKINNNKIKILSEKKILEENFKKLTPTVEAMEKLKKIAESHELAIDKDGVYDFNVIEDLIIKGKNGGAGGNTEEVQRELAEYKSKHRDLDLDLKSKVSVLEKTGVELKAANEYIEKLLIEDEIRKELIKSKDIKEELFDSLIIVLKQRSGAIVEIDTENPTNRRAVTKDGDSIPRFYELWKETPEGKSFRNAPQNTGGGSNHSGGGGSAKAFKDMTPSERTELYRSNPAEYQRRAAGSPK